MSRSRPGSRTMPGASSRASLDVPDVDDDRTRCFLLFAGSDPTPRGGLADLVGTFTSEAAARQAFRHIRLTQTAERSWAQLAVVDGDQGIRTLSWFGVGAKPAGQPLARPQTFINNQPERGAMQTATVESLSTAGPERPAAPRRRLRRLAVLLASVAVVAGAATTAVMSDDPATPKPAGVNAGASVDAPVVPFPTGDSAVGDGMHSPDR